jgi:hypothetical protein
MGAQQSTTTTSQPCFFFQSPFKGKNSNDLLGSPVPDTPMAHRKQREKALRSEFSQNKNNRNNNPIFSSRYNGLEKEDNTTSLEKQLSQQQQQQQQQTNKKNGKNNNNDSNNNGFVAKDALDMAESQFYAEIHEGPVR